MYRLTHRWVQPVTWLIATTALLITAACDDVRVTTVAADRVEIDPSSAQLEVNQTVRFTARVLSESGLVLSGRTVEWTSLQPGIAVVDENGMVRGLAPGPAVIQAKSEGVSAVATVNVTGGGAANAPAIAVAPQALSFSATVNGSPPNNVTVTVTNGGTGSLTGLSAAVRHAPGSPVWLSANLSSSSAPASLIVSANHSGLAAGTYTAAIDVSAPGVANSPVAVSVSLFVTSAQQPAPAIGLEKTSVAFSATSGGQNPASEQVAITNVGGGTLGGLSAGISYSGQGGGWLTASLSGTTAPTTLTLSAATGSLEPGIYTATVRVSSSQAVNSPQEIQVTFTVGIAAPGAPSNLTATAVSSSQIDLTWTASTGSVQKYRIQRRLTALGDYAVIDSVPAGTTVYQNTGLLPATSYTYRVEACGAGGCSDWSNEAAATTGTAPAIGLDKASVSFSATSGGPNPAAEQVAITNVGGGMLGGLSAGISYSGEGGGWLTASLSGTTAPTTLTLSGATGSLVPGIYAATVQVASDQAVNSPQQIEVTFTIATAPGAPDPPGNVTATALSATQVQLNWSAPGGQTSYDIRRRTGQGGPYTFTTTVPGDATGYENTGLTAGTTYQYQVRACVESACSDYTSPVTVRTQD